MIDVPDDPCDAASLSSMKPESFEAMIFASTRTCQAAAVTRGLYGADAIATDISLRFLQDHRLEGDCEVRRQPLPLENR